MSLFDPKEPTPLQHAQRSMDLVSRVQQQRRHPSHDYAKHHDHHHQTPYPPMPPQQKSSRTVVSCIINLLLSKLLDAILFTSALALAAYNYYKGELQKIEASPPAMEDRIMDIRQWRHEHPPLMHHHHHHSRQQYRESLEDSRRRRTMEWAEDMARQQSQHSSSNSSTSSSRSGYQHVRIYARMRERWTNSFHTQDGAKRPIPSDTVLPSLQRASVTSDTHDKEPQEDEMFTRMEEQLQSLIEQGQAALTSHADMMMDEQELTMRKAFAKSHDDPRGPYAK